MEGSSLPFLVGGRAPVHVLLLWVVRPHTRTGWDERVNGEGTTVRGTRAKNKGQETKKRRKTEMEWVVDTVNYRVQDLGHSKEVGGIIDE